MPLEKPKTSEWLCRYVPHKDAERYRKAGWTIQPLLGKHGVWSVLAVKQLRRKGKLYYKVLNEDGSAYHGGSGKWYLPRNGKPGKWMPAIANPEPCVRGYHLCRPTDIVDWLGPAIWVAEAGGQIIESDNKVCVERARLVARIPAWNERSARHFAADCAERVLSIFEEKRPNDNRPRLAIQAARDYADGKIAAAAWDAARAAAWDAAGDAAGAAARAAAGDAAWDAARAAAGAAAGAAAWAAAWDAARAAAGAAAWDAERKWQTERLLAILSATQA
jgi:hypothetical protein